MTEQAAPKFCIYCGNGNPPNTLICGRCKAFMPETTTATFEARPETPLGQMVVLVFNGDDKPLRFKLPENMRLIVGWRDGKSTSNPDIDLTPQRARQLGVSRQHISLVRQNGTLTLTDIGSRNGTYINGHWLLPDVVQVLADGDIIRLGGMLTRIYFDREGTG